MSSIWSNRSLTTFPSQRGGESGVQQLSDGQRKIFLYVLPGVASLVTSFLPGITQLSFFVASSILLFATGATFAYLTLTRGLHFLLGFASGSVAPLLTFTSYLSFVTALVLVFGASFEFPLGLLLLAALRWPTWRVPALAFATAHWALHAVSHLVDTNHRAGATIGWLEFAGLAISTGWLAVALWLSATRR